MMLKGPNLFDLHRETETVITCTIRNSKLQHSESVLALRNVFMHDGRQLSIVARASRRIKTGMAGA